jgi:hypothetical protein
MATFSALDSTQCIKGAYDDPSNSLKVTIVGDTIPEGEGIEVSISSTLDSIAIGNVAGDLMTVNPDGSIDVDLQGLTTFQTSQYTVGTSAVRLTTSPLSNRSSVSIKAVLSFGNTVYIGNSNSVTASTGYPLYNGDSLQMDLTGAQQIWAISTAASQTVAVLELA